jgi:hypothetical protein
MLPANLQRKLTPEQRRQIIAMAARGDTDVSIAKVMRVSAQSVATIRKNNAELLTSMKDTVNSYRAQKATDILDKAENLMIRKLNKALDDDKELIGIDELNRIAKSSYERVRLEQGRATSISAQDTANNGKASQMDLEQLVEAIKSGDEIKLQQMIFNPKQ